MIDMGLTEIMMSIKFFFFVWIMLYINSIFFYMGLTEVLITRFRQHIYLFKINKIFIKYIFDCGF